VKKPKKARLVLLPPVGLPHTLEVAIKDYYDWADKHFLAAERRNRISAQLYHYTDMRGFEGIVKSETIWFTDYQYLNDPNELIHGIGLAKGMLAHRIMSGGLHGLLFGWIDDLLTKRNFGRAFLFYIASFSRNGDDLGQWRAYADDGRGVAIGLSPDLFAPTEAINKDPRKNTFVGPVLYNDSQTRARHAKGIDKAAQILDAARTYARRHLRDCSIGKEFLNQLARSVVAAPLIWNSLTCKHVGYKHESEVRLVIIGEKKKFRGKVSKRMRDGKVIPYIPHHMPLREPSKIVSITIGPAAPSSAEATIRRVLKMAGISYNIPIRRSRIPYRASKGVP
jgi:Protein of unknown function (DUF2971)